MVGEEGEGQQYIQYLYSNLGLEVISFEAEREKISQHEAVTESELEYKGRPNIIGILEGESSARSLLLNGHIDVVPPGPIGEWDYSPWEAKVVGRKLYGRGALDMKGGLMANYFALKSILEAGLKPKGTVMLQSVVDEEADGGGGTLACLLEGFTADGLVIPEPIMEIAVAHPGVAHFRVRVTGKPAHAGRAHTGVNAISKMNLICQALVALDEKRAREKHYPLFEKYSERSCHTVISTYRAGDWPSTVAGWAEIEGRISYVPGESLDEAKHQVEQVVNDTAYADEWLRHHRPEIIWFGGSRAGKIVSWEQNPNDPLVVVFKACAEEILGSTMDIVGKTAGMDTRFAPYFGIPALSFGPNGENYHGVNEYVDLDSLVDCTKILASFMMAWCGYSAMNQAAC
ncbi:N-formyl-4-amino-5-aminomethyl-2-methylpyrimidine deformylase [subsurface metagenome]